MLAPLALAVLQAAAEPDLAFELERAVDLPDAGARAGAARELAGRADVTLESWLAAARAFGSFEPAAPGTSHVEVELAVGGSAPERTTLWLHVPASYAPDHPAPLLVALHGTGGTGEEALAPWVGLAESLGLLVLAPSEAGKNEGYAYTDRERDSVLAALRWMRRHYDVDEDRIHLTGVSRGGHLAWDLALRHPDLFASLAPMTGGPRLEIQEGRNNLRYLPGIAHVAIRDLQGAQDDPLLLFNLRVAFERLESYEAADSKLVLFDELGHDFDLAAVDWAAFFGGARRDPMRRRVVACSAGAGTSPNRSAWVEILETTKDVAETFAPEVNAARWNKLSPDEQRRELQRLVDARTARLEVERDGPASFVAKGTGVERFRILLTPEDLPTKGAVRIRFGSKSRSVKVAHDARVLLSDFVERFDRTFLPVADATVP